MFTLSLTIASCLVALLLIITFFSKKRINNIETRIYSKLLIINFIFSIFIVIVYYLSNSYDNLFVLKILQKSYLFFIICLAFYLAKYTFSISEFSKFTIKKVTKVFYLSLVVSFVLIFILPINVTMYDDVPDASGLAYYIFMIFILFYFFIIILSAFNMLLKNKNKMKKNIPFLVLIFLYSAGLFVRSIYPNFVFEAFLFSFSLLVMYFTIENPDMKMLEEVHRAKEISDNANEEKTLFLYNMTNDIRSITKDINKDTDYILEEIDNKKVNKEMVKEVTRDIKNNTARFTTMTNEILDISSIDTSSIKVYNDKYNIKLLLKQLVTNYKEKCKSKNIAFRSSIDITLPEYLYGDSVSLKKVLDTLLENSYKNTEKGYIELNVNTIIKNDMARLIISVEDSGTGMKIEELNRVLNSNKEEDNTNLNNTLYNARKLITIMGGTIIPSSTYGKGTIIKIILDQKIFEKENKTSKYQKELDKKKVLLVDDNISSQKIFTKILGGTNIDLDIVSLGKECLDKIRNKEKYDLILLDEDMKPIPAVDIISKLKNIKNFRTKVILLTRNNDYEYNDDYLKFGFTDYILKPLEKDKVLKKISKYL